MCFLSPLLTAVPANPVAPYLPGIFDHLRSINTHLSQPIPFMLPEYEGMMKSAITLLTDIVIASKGYPDLNPLLSPDVQHLLEMVKTSFPFPDLQSDASRALNRINTRLHGAGMQF